MLQSQIAHAIGIGHLYTRNESGKVSRVENEPEIERLMLESEERRRMGVATAGVSRFVFEALNGLAIEARRLALQLAPGFRAPQPRSDAPPKVGHGLPRSLRHPVHEVPADERVVAQASGFDEFCVSGKAAVEHPAVNQLSISINDCAAELSAHHTRVATFHLSGCLMEVTGEPAWVVVQPENVLAAMQYFDRRGEPSQTSCLRSLTPLVPQRHNGDDEEQITREPEQNDEPQGPCPATRNPSPMQTRPRPSARTPKTAGSLEPGPIVTHLWAWWLCDATRRSYLHAGGRGILAFSPGRVG